MNYALSNNLSSNVSGIDPDARLYIAAVEAVLPGNNIATALPNAVNPKRIISDFIKAEKAASRWALHKRFYLPIYNNTAASAVDMISRLSGTFTGIGSVTHAAGYVFGNGTSGYFNSNTGLPAVGASNASASMWQIIPLAQDGTTRADGVNGAGADRASLVRNSSNYNQWLCPANVTFASINVSETSAGIQIGSSTNTSNRFVKFRKSGAFATNTNTELNTTALPTGSIFFLARNNNGVGLTAPHSERRGGYGFGLGLTEAQAEGFAANLETLYEGLTGIALP